MRKVRTLHIGWYIVGEIRIGSFLPPLVRILSGRTQIDWATQVSIESIEASAHILTQLFDNELARRLGITYLSIQKDFLGMWFRVDSTFDGT